MATYRYLKEESIVPRISLSVSVIEVTVKLLYLTQHNLLNYIHSHKSSRCMPPVNNPIISLES